MKDPYWKKCLICGDSKDIIKKIPDNSIDFILTDPPYNIGQHSTGNIPLPGRAAMNNDVAEWDHIDFNPEEWADEFIRILKPKGNLFIFTSYNQIGRWFNCLDKRFDTSNFMIWHKTNPAPKIFKAGFLNSCEMIFTCWNKGHTWNFISQKEMHNFIESPICMRPERLNNPKHPAQKPVSILKKMISIASNQGDIIFDPFMGVGSVGVAALELDRKYIGIEIDKDYYKEARNRIEELMEARADKNEGFAGEPSFMPVQQYLFDIEDIFPIKTKNKERKSNNSLQDLKPIIKWAGGKEKELKHIIPNLPEFKNYYEPFVGGGSVFTAIKAEHYYINDVSEELISLYQNIADKNKTFFSYIESIDKCWSMVNNLYTKSGILKDIFLALRHNNMNEKDLKVSVSKYCEENEASILKLLDPCIRYDNHVLLSEVKKNLSRKMLRMSVLEKEKHELPDKDVDDNIITAFKSAVYMYLRHLYNDQSIRKNDSTLHCALFFFIRNYCYSGMFRYNDKGEFNVPYGGIGYNSKNMTGKILYYKSKPLAHRFSKTNIFNMDFEEFLNKCNPTAEDFIFLDPPYDTEFSTYAQHEFTKDDQKRLADYLINQCKAKWMLIIKYTDFIFNLYNKKGIMISTFNKKYLVSFMNRNNKETTHLLITNYEL